MKQLLFTSYSTYLTLIHSNYGASLVAQLRNLPVMRETWFQSLDQENHLEKGMATHSSILACRIPWTEEPGGLQYMGPQRAGHDWHHNAALLLQKAITTQIRRRAISESLIQETLFLN